MKLAEELEKLDQLHKAGSLTDVEYADAKARLLKGGPLSNLSFNQWAMALHSSQLLGLVLPLVGYILPIVIWQLKKQDFPELDAHGKMVANWLISELIYLVICCLLTLAVVGLPLLIALIVLGIVFPIMGTVKASEGQLWKYPMTISFLK